jgi:hypothetical protein
VVWRPISKRDLIFAEATGFVFEAMSRQNHDIVDLDEWDRNTPVAVALDDRQHIVAVRCEVE